MYIDLTKLEARRNSVLNDAGFELCLNLLLGT